MSNTLDIRLWGVFPDGPHFEVFSDTEWCVIDENTARLRLSLGVATGRKVTDRALAFIENRGQAERTESEGEGV